jgi:selT/selW/selH-like putative selenoprotein
LKAYKRDIDSLVLVPSDGGCFEVKKNGTLVFSKLAAGRFPEDGEIKAIFTGKQQPVTS